MSKVINKNLQFDEVLIGDFFWSSNDGDFCEYQKISTEEAVITSDDHRLKRYFMSKTMVSIKESLPCDYDEELKALQIENQMLKLENENLRLKLEALSR